jgi:hypothetical protein
MAPRLLPPRPPPATHPAGAVPPTLLLLLLLLRGRCLRQPGKVRHGLVQRRLVCQALDLVEALVPARRRHHGVKPAGGARRPGQRHLSHTPRPASRLWLRANADEQVGRRQLGERPAQHGGAYLLMTPAASAAASVGCPLLAMALRVHSRTGTSRNRATILALQRSRPALQQSAFWRVAACCATPRRAATAPSSRLPHSPSPIASTHPCRRAGEASPVAAHLPRQPHPDAALTLVEVAPARTGAAGSVRSGRPAGGGQEGQMAWLDHRPANSPVDDHVLALR